MKKLIINIAVWLFTVSLIAFAIHITGKASSLWCLGFPVLVTLDNPIEVNIDHQKGEGHDR